MPANEQVHAAKITMVQAVATALITAAASIAGAWITANKTASVRVSDEISDPGLIYTAKTEEVDVQTEKKLNFSAKCTSGDLATGGGFECRSNGGCNNLRILRSQPTAETRWDVRVENVGNETVKLLVFARCLKGVSTRN